MARSNKRARRKRMPTSAMPVGRISIASVGYGFVESPEGRFFVQARHINGAMDGDLVRLRPRSSDWRRRSESAARNKQGRAPMAVVDSVLERSHTTLVGMCVPVDGKLFIMPQDSRLDYLISIVGDVPEGLSDGDIVLAQMQTYPSRHEIARATIAQVLGRQDDEGIVEEMIAARYGIATLTDPELAELAGRICLDIEGALAEPDRRDIRERFILTIDPADAKDFDDALSLEYEGGLVKLGVHIADVSEYVAFGSQIDIDARRRATSTYFPGKVFPMLPPALSDSICSLMPERDRLAFTVDIFLRSDCTVERFEAYPSVIRSSLRLDYDGVQEMFDGMREYPSEQARATLDGLNKLAGMLHRMRIKRGALDFLSSELKVELDAAGKAIGVAKRAKTEATGLVEEAMILCNEVVAKLMLEAERPMVYRIHEEPLPQALDEALDMLELLGYADERDIVRSSDIQRILDDCKGKPHEELVNMVLLRSMTQAVYKERFTTHYGLASKGYCHFTSPIRRYPDLMVHRLLREFLFEQAKARGEIAADAQRPDAIVGLDAMVASLPYLCEHCSIMERKAEKASYDALDAKVCEYMEQFVGERFAATIIDVRSFGFFVRLDNGVEGFVPVRNLDGWFEYDEGSRVLRNEDDAKDRYRLGQRLDVKLTVADKRSGQLDFAIA